MSTRQIDHLVYTVPDLEAACLQIEAQLGMKPVIGGRHLTQGTKNALLNLGDGCYFEILAMDSENTDIPAPRWMGVDLITAPRMTRWALKSEDLTQDQQVLRDYDPKMGRIHGGQRQTTTGALLKWEMILPLPAPEVDLVPFMVDWSHSAGHPTDTLSEGCRLRYIRLIHPEPASVNGFLKRLGWNAEIELGDEPQIEVTLEGPKGIVVLS